MSRFVFSTVGSLGDLYPYVAVAKELVERGHHAEIATFPEYRASVETAGVGFIEVHPGLSVFGDYRVVIAKLFDPQRGPEYLIRSLVMPHLKEVYTQLFEAAKDANLLISHPLSFTIPLVAQKRGIPWVSTVLSPMSMMSCYDPPVLAAAPWLHKIMNLGPPAAHLVFKLIKRAARSWEEPLRQIRNELGLPPLGHLAMFEGQFSPLRNLALFDPQLAKPQPDWPANIRICGSPVYDGVLDNEDGIFVDLERFLGEGDAPVVFALGSSAVWIAGDFWEKAVAAVRIIGRRAILITGPDMPKSLPTNVKAFSYLPYSKVFPSALAVIHQAGIGTLAQAMRAGRPQLILPVSFDQPDNAQRTVAHGMGRTIPFKKATTRQLASELNALLSKRDYASAACAVANDLTNTNGAACAADELIACTTAGLYGATRLKQ